MEKTQVTLAQLHSALTICQLAIQEARKERENPALYEFLAKEYINCHLNGEYEIIN